MREETFKERQERENAEHYAKWLSCGFTGEMEVNEYGWFDKGNYFEGTKVTVFEKGYQHRAYVEYYQLPNGKWIGGSDLWCATHGYGSGASIWSKQYDTKEEAVCAELSRIEKALEDKDKKPFVLKAISKVRSNFEPQKVIVTDLVPAWEPGATFEQTTLW